MPTWSNIDTPASKPKFDVERQVREYVRLSTANTTPAGNTVVTLVYNDGAQNNVANVGVAVGQYVYFGAGLAGNGYPGFFSSNNTVAAINGNNVTLTVATFNTTAPGTVIEFDKAIAYNVNKPVEVTYNPDTILMTATRCANTATNLPTGISANQIGNMVQGWNHVQKKTNNDGTVRYIKECIVALANPVASNVSSANCSFGNFIAGL